MPTVSLQFEIPREQDSFDDAQMGTVYRALLEDIFDYITASSSYSTTIGFKRLVNELDLLAQRHGCDDLADKLELRPVGDEEL